MNTHHQRSLQGTAIPPPHQTAGVGWQGLGQGGSFSSKALKKGTLQYFLASHVKRVALEGGGGRRLLISYTPEVTGCKKNEVAGLYLGRETETKRVFVKGREQLSHWRCVDLPELFLGCLFCLAPRTISPSPLKMPAPGELVPSLPGAWHSLRRSKVSPGQPSTARGSLHFSARGLGIWV